jgi:hypothetical protein
MLQQVALMKSDPQFFGYKKPVSLISTSCVRHCEKSQRKEALQTARAILGGVSRAPGRGRSGA